MDKSDLINEYNKISSITIIEMRDYINEATKKLKHDIIRELESSIANYRQVSMYVNERINDILNKMTYDLNRNIINKKEEHYLEQGKMFNYDYVMPNIESKKEDVKEEVNKFINVNMDEIINDTMAQISSTLKTDNTYLLNRIYQLFGQSLGYGFADKLKQSDITIDTKFEEIVNSIKSMEKTDNKQKEEKKEEVKFEVDSGIENKNIDSFEKKPGEPPLDNMSYDELQNHVLNSLNNYLSEINQKNSSQINQINVNVDPRLNSMVNDILKNVYDRFSSSAIGYRNEIYSLCKENNMKADNSVIEKYENYYTSTLNDILNCIPDIVNTKFNEYAHNVVRGNVPSNFSSIYSTVVDTSMKNYRDFVAFAEKQSDIMKNKYKEQQQSKDKSDERKKNIEELKDISSSLSNIQIKNAQIPTIEQEAELEGKRL